MIPRLKDHYEKVIIANLQSKFSMKNKLVVQKILKVVLNMGLGLDANDKKKLQNCIEDMSLISGQKPIVTRFKKSISNFKTRKGTAAGAKVTLRRNKMYEFIDRLVNIALPRIKDFQGLSVNGFDNFGNYTLGIKEHIIFPEINLLGVALHEGEIQRPPGQPQQRHLDQLLFQEKLEERDVAVEMRCSTRMSAQDW